MYSTLHFDSRISNAFGRKKPGPVRPGRNAGRRSGLFARVVRLPVPHDRVHDVAQLSGHWGVRRPPWGLPSRLFFLVEGWLGSCYLALLAASQSALRRYGDPCFVMGTPWAENVPTRSRRS